MTEEMMQEILDDWNTRDQSKLDMITAILEEQLQLQKAVKRR